MAEAVRLSWGWDVRALTDRERLANPERCSVEGCQEPATHETVYYYRSSRDRRPWAERRAVCLVGAEEFANRHKVPVREAAGETRRA